MLKVALVTGSARRLGECMVRTLHSAGYAVLIHCHHSMGAANTLADELNAIRNYSACVVPQDLLSVDGLEVWMERCIEWKGRLDVLVNNASLFIKADDPLDEAPFHALWSIHVNVPWRISHLAYDALMHAQGSIINITDIHAHRPLKGYELYCQTKAALEMQTRALAKQFAPNVRVNAVAPGPTLWPEGQASLNAVEQERILAKALLNVHGDPRWVADAVLFFAENKAITGQSIAVDGGRMI